MYLFTFLSGLLTYTALAIQHQARQTLLPADVEMALVFPQPNKTYKPVYPFPIVLGIKGAADAYPYHMRVRWILQGQAEESMPEVSDMSWPITQTWFSEGVMEPQLEPLYLINGSNIAHNPEISQWKLTWFVYMQQLCEPANDGEILYARNGSIWFSTSSNSTMPNMTDLSCPRELHSFRITANKTTSGDLKQKGSLSSCLEIDDSISGDPCKFDIGPELDAAVKSRMLKEASCPANASWPDDRILDDPDWCKESDGTPGREDEEDRGIRVGVSYVVILFGLGASTFWYFLM